MATAYSAVKNHGGDITVDSAMGVGTTFLFGSLLLQEGMKKRKNQKNWLKEEGISC